MKGLRWTPAEEETLRRDYLARPIADLAATLGRKPGAIRVRASRLGVTSGYANGRPPRCACGGCALCRQRESCRRSRANVAALEARREGRS